MIDSQSESNITSSSKKMLFDEIFFGKQFSKSERIYNIIVVYYMDTIGDMQNEKYFYDHCNEFEYNHDLVVIVVSVVVIII